MAPFYGYLFPFSLLINICYILGNFLTPRKLFVILELVVQSLSPTLCDPMDCSMQGFPFIHHLLELLKLLSIESMMPSNHLILCRPLLLLPSIFPSIRVFSNESVLHIRWPKYWSFSFNISPSNEYSGLISFRIDCFDLLAVQRTLKSLLQHHSLKASILRGSAFFKVQPSLLLLCTYFIQYSSGRWPPSWGITDSVLTRNARQLPHTSGEGIGMDW